MDSIAKVYEQLLEEGISITDLYIYNCVVNDDYEYGFGSETTEQKFNKIKNNYANDYECRSLAYHIDKVLNGDSYEEDEEW